MSDRVMSDRVQLVPDHRTLACGPGKARPAATGSLLRDRDFDMLSEGRALTQLLEPGFEVLQRRPLDREAVPAVHQSSQCDLGKGQLLSREVRVTIERIVGDRPGGQSLASGRFDARMVALLRPGANQAEQQC